MIKIGVFGLSGETIDLARLFRQKKEPVELLFFSRALQPGQPPQETGFLSSPDADELISRSDRLIFPDPSTGDMPFIRQALRQSKPLFFIHTGRLSPEDMHEIVRLAAEADIAAVCFNPVWETFVAGKIPQTVHDLFYAEMVYRMPADRFSPHTAVDHLLFSLESLLRFFRAFPKKPVVNVYSVHPGQTDMILVRLDFDNSAMIRFRYEGLAETQELTCRLVQPGLVTTCDFIAGKIRYHKAGTTTMTNAGSIMLPRNDHPLYRSWKTFMSGEKNKNIFMEDRLAATRTHQYIREKIHYNTPAPRPVVKNLQ